MRALGSFILLQKKKKHFCLVVMDIPVGVGKTMSYISLWHTNAPKRKLREEKKRSLEGAQAKWSMVKQFWTHPGGRTFRCWGKSLRDFPEGPVEATTKQREFVSTHVCRSCLEFFGDRPALSVSWGAEWQRGLSFLLAQSHWKQLKSQLLQRIWKWIIFIFKFEFWLFILFVFCMQYCI